jgi:hypothetical protein
MSGTVSSEDGFDHCPGSNAGGAHAPRLQASQRCLPAAAPPAGLGGSRQISTLTASLTGIDLWDGVLDPSHGLKDV